MKITSGSSKRAASPSRKGIPALQTSVLTEEQRILQVLRECGAVPMTPATRRRLAKAGQLGMPEE